MSEISSVQYPTSTQLHTEKLEQAGSQLNAPLRLIDSNNAAVSCQDNGFFSPPLGGSNSNPIEVIFSRILDKFMSVIENLVGVIERVMAGMPTGETQDPQAVNDAYAADTTSPTPPSNAPGENKSAKAEGRKLGRTGEFLWKPESDKNGKLVVLLPGKFTGNVKSLKVLSPDGSKVLAKGTYSGTGNPMNGKDREHYRFEKSGSNFPDNSIIEITLNSGKKIQVEIGETSRRVER